MNALGPLRAPSADGAVLAVPPLDQAGSLLQENRRRLSQQLRILDRPLADLQDLARRTTLAQAREYLTRGGEPLPPMAGDRLVLAGHQPELFHPGVWVKNFALHGLGQAHGLVPLNFLVDNDIAKAPVLRVPQEKPPHLVSVPFDRLQEEVPYEERPVLDEDLFAGLPERVAAITRSWAWEPLLRSFWEKAGQKARPTPLLGERLAGARRALERRWGCHNLEVPVSRLCRTEPFAWFAGHLLVHLGAFHPLYNEVVRGYRRQHRIRSRQHPVPDLADDGDWLEAPFWAWQVGHPRRQRLWVRQTAGALHLRAGKNDLWPSLPTHDPGALVNGWQDLERHGYKVRTRALTTTLYARLFLADLFVHGIGGGKYDELTDVLLGRFFGLQPPSYLVVSATLLLPFPRNPVDREICRHLARQRRDVRWNPQRHLDEIAAAPLALQLAREKQQWIVRSSPESSDRRGRFAKLRDITGRLQPFLARREQELTETWRQCVQQVEANAVLSRRDFAFCLYPETRLRPFCQQFLAC